MTILRLVQMYLLLNIVSCVQCRYKEIPGVGHYKIHRMTKTWWDAQSYCQREEAYLAEIRSEGAFRALESFLEHYRDENIHLHAGFTDPYADGHIQWVTGGPVVIPGEWNAPWEGKQLPKLSKDRTCGTFGGFAIPQGGGLGLAACEVLRPFICERRAGYRRHILYLVKRLFGKIFH